MKRLGFLLLLLCINGDNARAGWGAACQPSVDGPVYRWYQFDDEPDVWALYANGVQVGGWRQSSGSYRALTAGGWAGASCPVDFPAQAKTPKQDTCPCCGENCLCSAGRPCDKPSCRCVLPGSTVESDGTLNFGLTRREVKRGPRHIHNGQEVSKARLMEVLGKPVLRDDSGELCLTVIGAETERKAVLADLASSPLLSPWKGRIKVKDFDPTHWAVKDAGFVTTGKPTIYCQAPDGKVLHRQDEYRGAEALAEALRKADPSYAPQKDPDLNKPLGFAVPSLDEVGKWLGGVPGWAWLGLGLFVYLRFYHNKGRM